MPERNERIRTQIESMEGFQFEAFAIELLRRTDYPWLNPTSSTGDLGEDARTETSELQHSQDRRISVAVSKTSTLTKIKHDCQSCRTNNIDVDVMVFLTPFSGNEDTIRNWKKEVQDEYGIELVVKHMAWLVPTASRPELEDLVDQYLRVEPLGGDFTSHIMERFQLETERGLRRVQTHITGIHSRIERYEIDQIEEQLRQGKQVIATGESGVGKSGIAHVLVENALEEGKSVLYLNCLRVVSINTEADLRRHFELNGSLIQAIQRLGVHQGCRLVVDQFDNTVGLPISGVLTDMLLDCSSYTGVEIVLVSRARETDERRMLEQFTSTVAERFVRLQINELNPEQVTAILDTLAVQPTQALVALGANLLNLELIAKIRATDPCYIWSNITSEVQLWEQYLRVIQERELPDIARETLNYAVDCARQSLQDEGNLVRLRRDLTAAQRRLISWGVLVQLEGRVYQFKHEQLRDYLYAWDATEEGKMPVDVVAELTPYKTRNVLLWMYKIYFHNDSKFSAEFARKIFNV